MCMCGDHSFDKHIYSEFCLNKHANRFTFLNSPLQIRFSVKQEQEEKTILTCDPMRRRCPAVLGHFVVYFLVKSFLSFDIGAAVIAGCHERNYKTFSKSLSSEMVFFFSIFAIPSFHFRWIVIRIRHTQRHTLPQITLTRSPAHRTVCCVAT